MKSSYS
jgi:inositol hexakisphosphate/diphosphoinositol-pentakisphosphate kinase